MQVQWTNKAKKRLEEIEAYIGQESPEAAKKVILTIIQKTATQLSKYPDSGKSGRKMGTRELLFSDRGRFRKGILKPVKDYWMQESIGKASEQIPRDFLPHLVVEHR